jgi:hypothetical protein
LDEQGGHPVAAGAAVREPVCVSDPTPRLVIRIEDTADPICGELVARERAPRRFTGWLELVGLIEQSRSEVGSDSEEAAAGEPGVSQPS